MRTEELGFGLLDIPRLPRLPRDTLLAALILPVVALLALAILAPRVVLLLVLFLLGTLRTGSYWLYERAPWPLGCLTFFLVFPVFVILTILMLPFRILLHFNLRLSGFSRPDAYWYIQYVTGPGVSRHDED